MSSRGQRRRRANRPSFVELFAGIGLVRLGLQQSGWRCLFAHDIDPKKQQVYEANFGGDDFRLGDIWELDPESVPHPVDLITASFPCIDLSVAGHRRGLAGQHSGTFWAFVRVLQGLADLGRLPPALMIENVFGFLTSHGGKDLLAAVAALSQLDYLVDAFVVDARHFTPQSRPRLFVVALTHEAAAGFMTRYDGSEILSEWNRVLRTGPPELRPWQLIQLIHENRDLGWGLVDLSPPPQLRTSLDEIIEGLPPESPRWWDAARAEKLIGQMSDRHKQVLERMRASSTAQYATVYRRIRKGGTRAELRDDGLAGCLRTPRGGSSKQIVVCAHRGEVRVRWMTPLEYARLQGAPEDYAIPENDIQAYFGFGDAVCVPVIDWVARHAINPALERQRQRRRESRRTSSSVQRAAAP